MTHNQIVAEIVRRAERLGILTHYCGRAERCSGDRGLPDLICAGQHGVVFIEVKTPGDTLDRGQVSWKWMLRAAGCVHEVMSEADLEPGHAVDMLLSFAATGQAA